MSAGDRARATVAAVGGVEVMRCPNTDERHRRHAPASLADAIVQAMPSHALGRLVADVRVEQGQRRPPSTDPANGGGDGVGGGTGGEEKPAPSPKRVEKE